jgi:hypothetical protein
MATGDVLFDTVSKWSGMRPWGKFLDAGTGVHSLKWISKLDTERWDAITADEQMRKNVLKESEVNVRSGDRVLTGNWMDDTFTRHLDTDYDTILADYLIGSVDGFSPYQQDLIIEKWKNHLKPGNGRIYVIGMNPIPDRAQGPANIVCEVRRVRDACILLANHRPYREYPLEWIVRHLQDSGFKVLHTKKCTILHSEESIMRQLKVASSKLELMHPFAQDGMADYLNDISRRIKLACADMPNGKIPLSYDYIIEAMLDDGTEPSSGLTTVDGVPLMSSDDLPLGATVFSSIPGKEISD